MNLAYIDPGSGSMILQMILGGLAAAAVFLKVFWHRLLVLLRIRRPDEETGTAERTEPGAFEGAGEPAPKR